MKNSNAFTLAEILITLGIIGVVAAMTIPSLIQNYKMSVLQNQFKKTYSEIQQINQSFIKDYDMNICEYEWNLFEQSPNISYAEASHKTAELFIKYYNGTSNKNYADKVIGHGTIKTLTNQKATGVPFDDGGGWDLHKRTFYFEIAPPNSRCPVITVDINGYYKKPNQLGIDVFSFRPTKNVKVIPLGGDNIRDAINGSLLYQVSEQSCSKTSNTSASGILCAYWANIDVNPDDNSKSYWKDFLK